MKKILCLLSASLLVLSSCSTDDNSPDPDPVSLILPKIMTYTYPDNPDYSSTSTVIYNGNKLVSVVSEHWRTDYTYDGNVIVKWIRYNTESGQDVKTAEVSYTYENGKVASNSYVRKFTTQFPLGQEKFRTVYTYNSDGTVKEEYYTTNTTTGIETQDDHITVSNFVNGNLVKKVESDILGSNPYTQEFEYDSKNNPFKNILGYNSIYYTFAGIGSINNIIKQTITYSSGSDYTYEMDNVYDVNQYLTKRTIYDEDGIAVFDIAEYTY